MAELTKEQWDTLHNMVATAINTHLEGHTADVCVERAAHILASSGLELRPIPASDTSGERKREMLDERMRWLLRYADACGGMIDAGDWSGNLIGIWCDDRGAGTDTFNLAIEAGYLLFSHDSDTDNSSARLTDDGRKALALLGDGK